MPGPHFFETDLIQELRLRRWARKNYVPSEERGASWHPVVLDEMNCRDREREEQRKCTMLAYVPLAPTICTNRVLSDYRSLPSGVHMIHEPHAEPVAAPRIAQSPPVKERVFLC